MLPGSRRSSSSRKSTKSPEAQPKPSLRTVARLPLCSRRRYLIRSPKSRSHAAVPSDDPSSTTTTSGPIPEFCSNTEKIASRKSGRRLYVAMTMLTLFKL